MEPRAKKCVFLGYVDEVKRYRLWCLDSIFSKFLISKDVTFNESPLLSLRNEKFDVENSPDMR